MKFAILGLVASNRDGVHGYALRQQCLRILGHLWQLTLQEVYRVLGQLADEACIEAQGREPVAGRRVYSITPLGQQRLDAFCVQPATNLPNPRREDLAAKLLFARPEHLPDLFRVIDARRDLFQQQLGLLAVQRRKLRRLPVDPFVVNLLIDGAEGSILAEIGWLDQVCARLQERFGQPAA
ncbi:MAG: PadR family transcriptional regulator [Mycobacteriales bacterium]